MGGKRLGSNAGVFGLWCLMILLLAQFGQSHGLGKYNTFELHQLHVMRKVKGRDRASSANANVVAVNLTPNKCVRAFDLCII